ncbi:DUF21 domain-containing protein [Musa troglodytarum]|uniref:DUF21 domain-containing protein n=2 Tax=Magnoliopsida TaxID=3398 RepID=A0A9E7HBJ8_9LILI|nr:DUF21 domain-containing protein [Musa troglodytarum]
MPPLPPPAIATAAAFSLSPHAIATAAAPLSPLATATTIAAAHAAIITRRCLAAAGRYRPLTPLPLAASSHAASALPLYLDKIFHPFVAVVLSVTFVLAFGEVIPQAICTRYGLAVGANFVWLVRILMIICYPIAYPIGKILDCALGHNESALFRRAQLKALVSIHSQEAGKGGELTHDETTIISGALDLTEKTAEAAMTPIESTFSLDVNSKLDWEAIGKILARGHSRVPVYSGYPKNIIGLLLVKSLLAVRAETETPVSAVSIRRIPRVPADMPLYDILNEFQKGSSHMAAVVKAKGTSKTPPPAKGEKLEADDKSSGKSELMAPLLSKGGAKSDSIFVDIEKWQNKQASGDKLNDAAASVLTHLTEDQDGEVIGIITLEDVFEELLQEEIVDETDEYVDVHKRIRVAAAAAASSVARAPSLRRTTGQKAAGTQNRQGQQTTGILRKPTDADLNTPRHQVFAVESTPQLRTDSMILQKSIVQEINANPNAGWQAAMNFRFENYTIGQFKHILGVKATPSNEVMDIPKRSYPKSLKLPKQFDARTAWPQCSTIGTILDGCDGGYPIRAWQYFVQNGVVTDECDPYFDDIGCAHPGCEPLYPTPQCKKKCKAKNLLWDQSKHFGVNAYMVNSDPKDIMTEVYTNGPVEVDFTVYEDFAHYKSGVYKHVTGDAIGGHAVKLIGWGTSDEGEDYWLLANQWNRGWGDDGYFKIIRGRNECGIEEDVVAGMPSTKNLVRYYVNSDSKADASA